MSKSQFLGISVIFRVFLKDYAKIAEPISKLQRKDASWEWGEDQEKAMQTLE